MLFRSATLLLGCLTPVSAYLVLRRLGRFSVPDAAGIAAHYGSVSAVTFIAAQQFTNSAGVPAEGFMPTLLTLLEIPGIQVALAIGAFQMARQHSDDASDKSPSSRLLSVCHELVCAPSTLLLVGGLVIGAAVGTDGWKPVQPVFEGMFKGLLTLFLLEMGLTAGARLQDLRTSGLFLAAFGILMPVLHGLLGAWLGAASGLSVGGTTMLATMADRKSTRLNSSH